LFNRGYRINE